MDASTGFIAVGYPTLVPIFTLVTAGICMDVNLTPNQTYEDLQDHWTTAPLPFSKEDALIQGPGAILEFSICVAVVTHTELRYLT